MRRLLVLLAAALALCVCACSTSNNSLQNLPGWDGNREFSLATDEGLGTFTPQLEVSEDAAGATAVISAAAAQQLEAAYLHLSYDASRYTPVSVEITSFLGQPSEVLTLALTDVAGEVPVGIRQIPASGVQPVDGSGELVTVRFKAEPFSRPRQAAKAPSGAANAVKDLAIISQTATTATLRWTEKNVGDYDNNGVVGISDLTPLGLFFNQQVATSSNPVWAGMVDGDGNGVINIADITPIGANLGNQLSGYVLFTDAESSETYGSGMTVARDPFFVDNKTPVVYSFVATVQGGATLYFSVKPVAEPDLGNPGPVSNMAQIVAEPGPPTSPTGLAASVGAEIGVGSIKLDWTASTSTDLAAYEVWHKLSSEDDSAWTKLSDVPALSLTYTDSGRTIENHDYRVRARDFTDQLSDWSNVATAEPFATPPPDAPLNVVAVPHPSEGSAIRITWEQPANGSAQGYKLYRKAPGESEFTVLATKNNKFDTEHADSGLTAGETYEYYVTSTATVLESAPSTTVSAQPSSMANISIVSLTTTKKTHLNSGSETPATLTVTTDIAPDSVDWTCSLGSVDGTGESVTWTAPEGSAAQKVDVTCTVHKGGNTDSASLNLYVTEYEIDTMGPGGGKYAEIAGFPTVKQQSAPYMSLSSLFEDEGHVVVLSQWGIWCYYCRIEMPDFQIWQADWGVDGMYCTGIDHWDSVGDAEAWFTTNGCPDLDTFIVDTPTAQNFFNNHAFGSRGAGFGSAPMNVIYDRDGYARYVQPGSLTYNPTTKADVEKCLKQLLGIS